MSKLVEIQSPDQLKSLLSSSKGVVVDCTYKHPTTSKHIILTPRIEVYADWCGPCKTIAPIYEGLSTKYSRQNAVTFTKVNTDIQPAIAQQYNITAYVFLVPYEISC